MHPTYGTVSFATLLVTELPLVCTRAVAAAAVCMSLSTMIGPAQALCSWALWA